MLNAQEFGQRWLLEGGLSLCTAGSAADVQRVAEFNGVIHGPGVVGMTTNLFLHHPHTSGRDLIWVENETGQVVSSLCLIPWEWHCEDAVIPAGELGIVGTAEAYRHRGLIRVQMDCFKRRLAERGCLLSQIQGIPYYYRQFGYEYALPLEGGLKLEEGQMVPPFGGPFTFRPAGSADIPVLARLYDDAADDLAVHAVRGLEVWDYLLQHTAGTEVACETWLIEDADTHPIGYLRVPQFHFGDELAVSEASRLDYAATTHALDFLKRLAVERRTPGIRLNLPANCTLMRLARSLGARDLGTYAWQIHLPDPVALLRRLTPVFERRLAASPFARLTLDLRLSFYRETVALSFRDGCLAEVISGGFGNGDINCPPAAFTPMVLGHRTIDELRAIFPDLNVSARWRLLVDVLFPKVNAFIYTTY
jgi:hypothetical protein